MKHQLNHPGAGSSSAGYIRDINIHISGNPSKGGLYDEPPPPYALVEAPGYDRTDRPEPRAPPNHGNPFMETDIDQACAVAHTSNESMRSSSRRQSGLPKRLLKFRDYFKSSDSDDVNGDSRSNDRHVSTNYLILT